MVGEPFADWLLPKSAPRRRHYDTGGALCWAGRTKVREVDTCPSGKDRPRYMKDTFVSQQKAVKNRLTIYQMTNIDPSQRLTCDLDWRDGGSGGQRSLQRPQGQSPTAKNHHGPYSQPTRLSYACPSGQSHPPTETIITLLPSHLGTSPPDRPRRAFFHLRSDGTGERSASNQSLSDGRDTAAGGVVGELPRLPTLSHGSADSNAKHSSGVFFLPSTDRSPCLPPTDTFRIDSPRFKDHRDRLGGGRGSQWSPISKDSVENSRENGAAKLGLESNPEPTSSRLLQREHQDLHVATRRSTWTTRQRNGSRPDARPSQGSMQQEGYTQEMTVFGGAKVSPLTRINQILSKSNTNISKSDFLVATGRQSTNISSLQRYCSEMNLVNPFIGYATHRGPQLHLNTAAQKPASLATQPNRKPLTKSQSHPVFRPGNGRQRLPANRKLHPQGKNDVVDTPEAEEKAKQERIIEWLLDIDGYADPPDSPIIFEDEPLQSDTAIHVVYQGD